MENYKYYFNQIAMRIKHYGIQSEIETGTIDNFLMWNFSSKTDPIKDSSIDLAIIFIILFRIFFWTIQNTPKRNHPFRDL